jgi:hypothetical protein
MSKVHERRRLGAESRLFGQASPPPRQHSPELLYQGACSMVACRDDESARGVTLGRLPF